MVLAGFPGPGPNTTKFFRPESDQLALLSTLVPRQVVRADDAAAPRAGRLPRVVRLPIEA